MNTNLFRERTFEELQVDRFMRSVFKTAYKYASENGFPGGFPTNYWRGKLWILLINPGFAVTQDATGLEDMDNISYGEHIRNVDRYLNDDNDERYLGGFPNFHQSGRLFGTTRISKNAGIRDWVATDILGIKNEDSDFTKIQKAHRYAETMGFAGGYTNLEHRGRYYYEVIFISKEAATIKEVQIPLV